MSFFLRSLQAATLGAQHNALQEGTDKLSREKQQLEEQLAYTEREVAELAASAEDFQQKGNLLSSDG